jgi:hypothetical protein
MNKQVFVSALALLLVQSPAQAEWEVGTFLGIHHFSANNRLGRYPLDTDDTSLDTAPTLGLRAAFIPKLRWGVEAEVSAAPTATKDSLSGVTVVRAGAHLIVNLLVDRVRPFVLLGAGGAFSQPSNPLYFRRDADASAHGGVGLRFDVNPDIGIRADLRLMTASDVRTNGVALDVAASLGCYGRFPWQKADDVADTDQDGIADKTDECPKEPGTARNGGCPDKSAPALKVETPKTEASPLGTEPPKAQALPLQPEPTVPEVPTPDAPQKMAP